MPLRALSVFRREVWEEVPSRCLTGRNALASIKCIQTDRRRHDGVHTEQVVMPLRALSVFRLAANLKVAETKILRRNALASIKCIQTKEIEVSAIVELEQVVMPLRALSVFRLILSVYVRERGR